MKLHCIIESSKQSVLVVVHPIWIVDHYRLADDYQKMVEYLDRVLGLIEAALQKGMRVVVTHITHGQAEFDLSSDWDGPPLDKPIDDRWPLKTQNPSKYYVAILDGNYWYFENGEPFEPLVGVKNREYIDDFRNKLETLNNTNFDFVVNPHFSGGEDLIHAITKLPLPADTHVLIAGGNKDACVAAHTKNIEAHLPRIRLLTKYIY